MSGEVAESIATPRRPALGGRAASDAALWRATTIALSIIAAALIALYWSEAAGAVRVWYGSRAYNHGFLILPIVLYLVWERRAALRVLAPHPFFRVLPLIPAIGVVWLVARLIGLLEAQQMLLVAIIEVALLAVLGWRVYRALAFPLLYLFFLVPTGEFLVPALQDFTSRFVVLGLQLSHIPVYSDGFLISIPNENFYVAEACAGLRFLIATIAFSFLFADFTYRSLWRKACFIALCLVTPVIANGIRAYGIILIAYWSDGRIAAGVDHILYGWIFFSLVTVALMAIGWTFRDIGRIPGAEAAAPASGTAEHQRPSPSSIRRVVACAALTLVLVALPRAYAAYVEQAPSGAAQATLTLPAPAAPWIAEAAADNWHPSFPAADVTAQQGYRTGARRVDLFVAYYLRQDQDKKLVSYGNALGGDRNWEISNRSNAVVTLGGEKVPVAVTEFNAAGRKRIVLSVYWVGQHFERNPVAAKLMQAKAELLGSRPEAAVIAFATDVADDQAAAIAAIGDFAAHLPPLRPLLARASGR